MILRIYHERKGDHVHMRVFTGISNDQTFANCGNLVMRTDEFEQFEFIQMAPLTVQFIPETN